MENDKLRATPAARNLAKKLGVDLFKVQGSGAKGRVHKEDVDILKLIAKPQEKEELIRHEVAKVVETKQINESDIEIIPMSPMRKVIAKRMSESYFTAPTFTLNYEIDMTETKALRAKILDIIFEKTGKKVTITDIISLAVIRTLMKHKYVNSSLTEDGNQIILIWQ